MKLSIVIEGIPRINQSIHYTKKGIKYKPATEIENEKLLRAGIMCNLPYEFKPLCGALKINKLFLVFPLSGVLSDEEKNQISKLGIVEKTTKPDLTDCIRSLFKAMSGVVFNSDTQICSMTDVYKYYGAKPGIEVEIEEVPSPNGN